MSFFYGDTKTDELVVGQTSSSNGYIDLYDSGTTNKITLRAPNSITSSYNLTLPTAIGAEDQALVIADGVGNISFSDQVKSAKRVVFTVKNNSAATLTAGTPVYIDGTAAGSSGRLTVRPTNANSPTTMPAAGLIEGSITAGSNGILVEQGEIFNVDTSTYDTNDTLFVDSTTGNLTINKPGYPNLIQNIGRVGRVDATEGFIIVTGPSRTNDVPNLGDSNIWIGKGTGFNTVECPITGDVSLSNLGVVIINGISNTATITSAANISMDTDQAIIFRNANTSIQSSVNSKLNIFALSNISLEAPTVHISDTLRIAENGTGLRMTNVGAFDNDSGDFRIFATSNLKLCANGDTNVGLSIDSSAYNVAIHNDLIPNIADGSSIGSVTNEWSDLYLADGAVINLGNDQDVTLTHIADTGVRINDDSQLQFRNANTSIQSSADSNLSVKVDNTIFNHRGDVNYLTISSNADASCVAVSFIGKSYNSNSTSPGVDEGKTGGSLDILAASGSSNISGQYVYGSGGAININKYGYGLGGNNFNNNAAGNGSSINLNGGQGGYSYLNTSLDDGTNSNSVGGNGGSISLTGGTGGSGYDGGNGGDLYLSGGYSGFGSNSSGNSGNIYLNSNIISSNPNINFDSNISLISTKKLFINSNSYINSEFGSLYIKNQEPFGSTYLETPSTLSLSSNNYAASISVSDGSISMSENRFGISLSGSNITTSVSSVNSYNTMNGQIVYGVDTLSSGGTTDGTRVEIKSSTNYNSVKSIIQTVSSNNNVHYFHANSGGQTGEMMHILYYNANVSGSANIDFNTTNLYSGTGANRYLEFDTPGQSATLIWIDNASATIAGWRIINTGGAVRGT